MNALFEVEIFDSSQKGAKVVLAVPAKAAGTDDSAEAEEAMEEDVEGKKK